MFYCNESLPRGRAFLGPLLLESAPRHAQAALPLGDRNPSGSLHL